MLTELVEVHFPNAIEKIKKSYTSQNKVNKQNIEESNKKWINLSLTKEALLPFDNKKAAGQYYSSTCLIILFGT